MGYIWQTLWDIFGKNYEIYWAKTIGYLVGYIGPKVWDILGKNYGIYYGIYWFQIDGYILQNYGIYWPIGYIKQKLRNVL